MSLPKDLEPAIEIITDNLNIDYLNLTIDTSIMDNLTINNSTIDYLNSTMNYLNSIIHALNNSTMDYLNSTIDTLTIDTLTIDTLTIDTMTIDYLNSTIYLTIDSDTLAIDYLNLTSFDDELFNLIRKHFPTNSKYTRNLQWYNNEKSLFYSKYIRKKAKSIKMLLCYLSLNNVNYTSNLLNYIINSNNSLKSNIKTI